MKTKAAIEALVTISAYAGERFDLVQAGGGNSSVKFEDGMLIKSSGYLLSEVTEDKGYVQVDTARVIQIMEDEQLLKETNKRSRDTRAAELLGTTIIEGTSRPSIETYLHALLDTYTLHVHAIAVNYFTSHVKWEEECRRLNPEALLVPYDTPGIELAVRMKEELASYREDKGEDPKVIFLQNHGLIVSSGRMEEVAQLTDEIVQRAEQLCGMDLSRYRMVSKISSVYNRIFSEPRMAYLSEDKLIEELLRMPYADRPQPFSPDGFVFCGYRICKLKVLEGKALQNYAESYGEPPKVVIYKDRIFILAQDLKKAKMMEDVLKNNLLLATSLGENLAFIEEEEVRYLMNWEAEKYRQNLSQ